jgi:hypothetical protein
MDSNKKLDPPQEPELLPPFDLPRPLVQEIRIYISGIRAYASLAVRAIRSAVRDDKETFAQRALNPELPGDQHSFSTEMLQSRFSEQFVNPTRHFLHRVQHGLAHISSRVKAAILDSKISEPGIELLTSPDSELITAGMILGGDTPQAQLRFALEESLHRLAQIDRANPTIKIQPDTIFNAVAALAPLRKIEKMCESALADPLHEKFMRELPDPEPSALFSLRAVSSSQPAQTPDRRSSVQPDGDRPGLVQTALNSKTIDGLCERVTQARVHCHAALLHHRDRSTQVTDCHMAKKDVYPEGVTKKEALRVSQNARLDLLEEAIKAFQTIDQREMRQAQQRAAADLKTISTFLDDRLGEAKMTEGMHARNTRQNEFDQCAVSGMANLQRRLKANPSANEEQVRQVLDGLGGLIYGYREQQQRIITARPVPAQPIRRHVDPPTVPVLAQSPPRPESRVTSDPGSGKRVHTRR